MVTGRTHQVESVIPDVVFQPRLHLCVLSVAVLAQPQAGGRGPRRLPTRLFPLQRNADPDQFSLRTDNLVVVT